MTERSFIFTPDFSIMTKAEKTKQFIIEKSAPIFNTKGIAGTAMSDIMAATKLAKGSLYVHFESKDELSYCAVDYILNRFSDRIRSSLQGKETAKQRLLSVVGTLLNAEGCGVAGGCPILNFGMEADDTNPVILEKINKSIGNSIKAIAQIIDAGVKEGAFKSGVQSKEFATKLFALIEGAILISRISGNVKHMSSIHGIIKKEIEEMCL